MPAVGSSSTSTRGFSAMTDATATFCFWPPESSAIPRWRRSEMPIASNASAIRPSTWSFGTPKFSMPYSTSSSTTDDTICESMSWHTLPTRRLMSVNDASHVSNPSMVTLP